jgi:acyl-CoA synthetase (AMP-forming)/AMP-acid ligase II
VTSKTDWHLASVWENISDAIPKAPAVRYNDIALTWREYDERAARLAQVFAEAKLDVGSKVAIYSHNRN